VFRGKKAEVQSPCLTLEGSPHYWLQAYGMDFEFRQARRLQMDRECEIPGFAEFLTPPAIRMPDRLGFGEFADFSAHRRLWRGEWSGMRIAFIGTAFREITCDLLHSPLRQGLRRGIRTRLRWRQPLPNKAGRPRLTAQRS